MMKKYQTDPDKRFLPDYAKVSLFEKTPIIHALTDSNGQDSGAVPSNQLTLFD